MAKKSCKQAFMKEFNVTSEEYERLYIIILNSVKRVYAPFAVRVRVNPNGDKIKHYEQAKDN